MSLSLSLREIESQLPELIACRDEAYQADRENPSAETAQACDAIEQEIQRYIAAEIRKVDGTAEVLIALDNLCHEPRERKGVKERCEIDREIDRLRERRDTFRENMQILKDSVAFVMEGMTWKEGKPRKLEGIRHSLSLRGNGGAQPVEVYDASMVPDEMCQLTITIPQVQWKSLLDRAGFSGIVAYPESSIVREPRKSLIAEALNKPCEECGGSGTSTDPEPDGVVPCESCCGTGKASVPGARLAPRGVSVIVA